MSQSHPLSVWAKIILSWSPQETSCSFQTWDLPAAIALENPLERIGGGIAAPSLNAVTEGGEQVHSLLHVLAQRDHPYLSHTQMIDLCSNAERWYFLACNIRNSTVLLCLEWISLPLPG